MRNSASIQFGATCLDDFNFKQPTMALRATNAAETFTALEFSDNPGEYVDKAIGDRLARVRLEEHQCARQVIQMATVARGLISGCKFSLIDHPNSNLNREYLITHISHRATQSQSGQDEADGSQVGTRHELDLRCIQSDVPFRPPRVTPRPTVLGSQTARVTGPAGEEIYTDKYGRVKVKFHWDREGEHDEHASCWIRVSQGLAGGNYGIMFLPRVGQEVVVDFLEGNPDRPLITGRVYNNDHMPPYTLPDEKTKSCIKTHSSKGGGGTNEIRFEDQKDNEQIMIFAQKDLHIRTKDQRVEAVECDRHLKVGNDKIEQIGRDKSVKVKGKESYEIDGTRSLTVGSDVVEVYKSNHKHEVASTYATKAASIKLEADSMIELKCGGSSIVLTPSAIFVTGGPIVNINSGSGGTVGPVTAGATSATAPNEADKAVPGKDVTYSADGTRYELLETVEARAADQERETPAEEKTWVAISLVDEEGNPVPGEPYEIVVPGGRVIRGSLDANGKARVTGIDPGTCPVTFPRLDTQSWDRVERHPPRSRPPVPDEPPEVEPEDPDEGDEQPDDSIDPLETAGIEQREQEELEAWNRQREQEAEEDGSGEAGQQQAQDDG